MKPKGSAPSDNPASAMFDLADQMVDNYSKIKYIKYYAYIFITISLILLFLLSIYIISEGNVAFFIILLALIISGIMLLRLIIFTKNFLDDFDKNFNAIKMVRDIDPLPKVPIGRTSIKRFENYLKNQDPTVTREIKLGLEIIKNFKLEKTKWDLAVLRRPRSFGPRGHLTLIKREKGKLQMKQFIDLEKELETLAKEALFPERIIILNKAPDNYDGISDDLYSYLTEKSHYIIRNGRKQMIKLQLFVETHGRYEIIPLIP